MLVCSAVLNRASVDNALVEYEKRTYAQEMSYIEKVSECCYRIKKGFVPNMKVFTLSKTDSTFPYHA
jgi:hypothetical protein